MSCSSMIFVSSRLYLCLPQWWLASQTDWKGLTGFYSFFKSYILFICNKTEAESCRQDGSLHYPPAIDRYIWGIIWSTCFSLSLCNMKYLNVILTSPVQGPYPKMLLDLLQYDSRLVSSHFACLPLSCWSLDLNYQSLALKALSHNKLSNGLHPQAFDDLLLVKIGGRVIYHGSIGAQSKALIQYFQVPHKRCQIRLCFQDGQALAELLNAMLCFLDLGPHNISLKHTSMLLKPKGTSGMIYSSLDPPEAKSALKVP